jgi:hypothetical protein
MYSMYIDATVMLAWFILKIIEIKYKFSAYYVYKSICFRLRSRLC